MIKEVVCIEVPYGYDNSELTIGNIYKVEPGGSMTYKIYVHCDDGEINSFFWADNFFQTIEEHRNITINNILNEINKS